MRFLGLAKTGAVREGKDTSAGFRQKLVELLLGETGGPVKWGKIYVEILFFVFFQFVGQLVYFGKLYVTHL